jgi:hypothetical protein
MDGVVKVQSSGLRTIFFFVYLQPDGVSVDKTPRLPRAIPLL